MKKILIILFLSISFFLLLSSPTKVLAACTLNGVSVATGTQFCRGESYVGQFCTTRTEYGTCLSTGSWQYNTCAAGTSCGYDDPNNISCYAACLAPPPPPPVCDFNTPERKMVDSCTYQTCQSPSPGSWGPDQTCPPNSTLVAVANAFKYSCQASAGSCTAPPPPPPAGSTHTCITQCDSFTFDSPPIDDACSNHTNGLGEPWSCSPWSCTPPPPPPPTATLIANPTSINLGETSTLSWTSTDATSFVIDQGVGSVTPAGGSTTVSPIATTTYTGTADGPGGTITDTATVTVRMPDPWTQGTGGDMRSDTGNDLNNEIPVLAAPAPVNLFPFFSITSSTLSPGGIAFGLGLNLGNNRLDNPIRANLERRYVNTNYANSVIRTSYDFLESTLNKNGISVNLLTSNIISAVPSANVNSYYSYPSALTFNNGGAGAFNFSGGNYIFLINGDININSNITVAPGSTVFFIANGNINVADNVTGIQGIFSADGSFAVRGNPDPALNNPLEIQGNVIGIGSYTNNRDLGVRNANTPSVSIIYRPDFVLSAPQYIRYTNYTIKEIAPGSD